MDLGTRAADVTGRALGLAFAVAARVRPADKPLHPVGTVAHGSLVRRGVENPAGVAWLDEPGTDEVFVRVSQGGGLPRPLPDVPGLALRVYRGDGELGDLLFTATGSGTVTRYLFRPAYEFSSGKLGTLMPYCTPAGARLLAVEAGIQDDGRLVGELLVAGARGPWTSFATLTTEPLQPDADRDTAFDAFLNTVPGLQPYDWIQRLRERSYAAARGSRDAHVPRHVDEPTARPGT